MQYTQNEGSVLDPSAPLMDSGLDSLSAVEFRNTLQRRFPGVRLAETLAFDYPNGQQPLSRVTSIFLLTVQNLFVYANSFICFKQLNPLNVIFFIDNCMIPKMIPQVKSSLLFHCLVSGCFRI